MAIDLAEFLRTYVSSGIAYDAEPATEAGLIGELIPEGASVLDLGAGHVAQSLVARGCSVRSLSLVELESAPLERIAAGNHYDVVLLSDTLGYVREPEKLLIQCRSLLKADGFIVASVTNFGYGGVRLAMLAGTFEQLAYAQELTPRSHFFSAPLLSDVFTRAGYRMESMLRLSAPWDHAAKGTDGAKVDEAVVRQLKRDPENTTLMFVVKAAPALRAVPQPEAESVETLKRETESLKSEVFAANALIEELRAAGRALQQQNGELRRMQPAPVPVRSAEVEAEIAALRSEARRHLEESSTTLRALEEAIRESAAAAAARDQLLVRVHAMDAEMGDLRAKSRSAHEQNEQLRQQNAQLQQQRAQVQSSLDAAETQKNEALKRAEDAQNRAKAAENRGAEAEKRAGKAERQLLEQTNGLLESTQSEIRKLSDLLNVVQTSRFWKLKAFVAKLGRRGNRQIG